MRNPLTLLRAIFNRSEMMKKEVSFFYGAKIPQTRQDRGLFVDGKIAT